MPPSSPPHLFTALSSHLYSPPSHTHTHTHTRLNIHPASVYRSVRFPFTDVYCTYCERARGTAALLSYCYNQDDALSASSELASLLLVLFFQRAMQQGRCCVSEAEPAIKDFCCAFTVQQYDGDGIKCHKIDGDVHKMGEKHRHSASM